ncbi:restriction endonuclease subunit S [Bacteroidota bacterium]
MKTIPKHMEIGREKQLPSLRFPEFNYNWIEKRYGDTFVFKQTNSLPRESLNYKKGTVKNIHYGDIHTKFKTNFDILDETVPYINDGIDISNIYKENYCKEGDIIIADASEDYDDVGKVIEIRNLDNQEVVAGLHTYIARPKQKLFKPGFLSYLMQSRAVRLQIMMLAQGIKVYGISKSQLSKVLFKIPNLLEQQKIADFLSSVDKKIQQLTRKKELLEQYKKGVMQKIFRQEIRFKPEKAGFGPSTGSGFSDQLTELVEVSKLKVDDRAQHPSKNGGNESNPVVEPCRNYPDWKTVTMGEVFERVTRKNKENNSNVITISALHGLINQEDFFNKSVAALDVTSYYLLDKGEFAYNKSYSKGYPMGAIKRLKKYDKGVVSTLYICFKIREAHVPEFYEEFLDNGGINRELHKIAQEGARSHGLLNLSVVEFFKDVKIPKPSFAEQKRIADFLSNLTIRIEWTFKQLEQTQQFKKGLLQQMFV